LWRTKAEERSIGTCFLEGIYCRKIFEEIPNAKDIANVILNNTRHVKFPHIPLLALVFVPFLASAQFDYKPTQYLPGINDPKEIVAGDFDGNGLEDMLVNFAPPSGMMVFYSQPSFNFTQKKIAIGSGETTNTRIAVADLNNDGKDDFVFLEGIELGVGHVLVGLSDGTDFDISAITDITDWRLHLDIVDFNSDGKKDIVLGGNQSWFYFQGDGAGNFASGSTDGWPLVEESYELELLDLDNDGGLEFVAVRDNRISTWHTDGVNYIQADVPFSGFATAARFADLSGDHFTDLVVLHDASGGSELQYFINDHNNSFQTPIEIPTPGTKLSGLDLFDYDSDGRADILTGQVSAGRYTMLIQNPPNGFVDNSPAEIQNVGIVDAEFVNLDGTGKPEIVAATTHRTLTYFQHDGSAYGKIDALPFGAGCSDGKVHDLDNDGFNDIIGASSNGAVVVWYGDGNMSFEYPVFFKFFGNAEAIEVADLNDDGFGDIAVSNFDAIINESSVSVMLSTGARTFGPPTQISTTRTELLLAGDMNIDTDIDLVTDKEILSNDGDGNFTSAGFTGPTSPVEGTLIDLNDDSYPDITISAGGKLYFALNGSGSFSPFFEVDDTDGIYHIKAVDFDGDALTDLVGTMTLENNQSVAVTLQSTGNGEFDQTRHLPTPVGAHFGGADIGFINGDNVPDLVTDQQDAHGAGIGVYTGRNIGEFNDAIFFSSEDGGLFISLGNKFFLYDINNDTRPDALIFCVTGAPVAILEATGLEHPAVGPSDITVVPGITSATISLTEGDGNGRLIAVRQRIFIEESADPSEAPEDGRFYSSSILFGEGSRIGDDEVVMFSDETSVIVEGLAAGSRYYVFAYEYTTNGRQNMVDYLQDYATTEFKTLPPLPVGLEDDPNSLFTVSPNPGTSSVRIGLPGGYPAPSMPVFHNMIGEQFNLPVVHFDDHIEVNTSSLPAGMYVIRLQNVSLKMIKQ